MDNCCYSTPQHIQSTVDQSGEKRHRSYRKRFSDHENTQEDLHDKRTSLHHLKRRRHYNTLHINSSNEKSYLSDDPDDCASYTEVCEDDCTSTQPGDHFSAVWTFSMSPRISPHQSDCSPLEQEHYAYCTPRKQGSLTASESLSSQSEFHSCSPVQDDVCSLHVVLSQDSSQLHDDPTLSSPHTPILSQSEEYEPSTARAPLRVRPSRQSLAYGVLFKESAVVEKALECDADPNCEIYLPYHIHPEYSDRTCPPLLLAGLNAHECVLDLLLRYGAAVDSVNSLNQTAAHLLCQQSVDVCDIPEQPVLLGKKQGIPDDDDDDVPRPILTHDHMGSRPCLPTHVALPHHDLAVQFETTLIHCLAVLIRYNINLGIQDMYGKTAFDYAKENSLVHVTNYLESYDTHPVLFDDLTPVKKPTRLPPFPDLTPCNKHTRQAYNQKHHTKQQHDILQPTSGTSIY